jgi:hypothetical protein
MIFKDRKVQHSLSFVMLHHSNMRKNFSAT